MSRRSLITFGKYTKANRRSTDDGGRGAHATDAHQGLANAQNNLGLMYANSQGVSRDYVESHKWLNLAASRASGADQKRYAEARDAVAKLMTPTQIEAAQKLAREWLAAFQKRGGK